MERKCNNRLEGFYDLFYDCLLVNREDTSLNLASTSLEKSYLSPDKTEIDGLSPSWPTIRF